MTSIQVLPSLPATATTTEPGYTARARHYAAEISQLAPPDALAGLLRPGLRVAELPSGTGHFLSAYRAAAARVTMIDPCAGMLHAARVHAAGSRLLCTRIQDLTQEAGPFDLIVMPNAALNQLAADTPTAGLLTAAARPLQPGGRLLAQILNPVTGGACGFYDPGLLDGTWHVDREFTSDNGQAMTRRRRQHHTPPLARIDFELRSGTELLYRHHVTLLLATMAEWQAALAAAGFTQVTATPGAGGLTELLATRSAPGTR